MAPMLETALHRLLLIVALALASLMCISLRTSYRLAESRQKLIAGGFPSSYLVPLLQLQKKYPYWDFQSLPVVDMDWSEVIRKEGSPGWNLVVFSKWAPAEWRTLGSENYRPYYAPKAKAYDSGAWYQASQEAIAYFMDPRNFLNEEAIFMFESLEYDAAIHTVEAVERALSQTFMANACYDGGKRRFSELIVDVGAKLGVSPLFLAGRLASEQGGGTVQAKGLIGDSLVQLYTNATDRVGDAVVWGKTYTRKGSATAKVMAKGAAHYNGYYNLFNIGACGTGLFEIRYNAWREASGKEVAEKFGGPWTTQAKAIEGGAKKIKVRYIDSHRHTRYLQKFSVSPSAGNFRWKQYMQNIAAPLVEARTVSNAYRCGKQADLPRRFVIPVYRNMPEVASGDPAHGRSVYSSRSN